MRLLLLEDDLDLGEGLRDFLQADGHRVDWFKDLRTLRPYADEAFDAWLLDWNLPDGQGIDWLQAQRRRGRTTPAFVLTARDRLNDRIQGLDEGADDFLVKPFAPEELAARLRALARRLAGSGQVRRLGDLAIDLGAKTARKAERPVELTAREWTVLEALALRPGRIVRRDELEQLVCGLDGEPAVSNALEVHVSRLRRKLGQATIETVRGLGYRMPSP